jgi:hypothetical protein
MQFNHCRLEFDGPVATLVLDHQEVMNAVSVDMLAGLSEAMETLEEKAGGGSLPRDYRRRQGILYRRQPSRPQQPERQTPERWHHA